MNMTGLQGCCVAIGGDGGGWVVVGGQSVLLAGRVGGAVDLDLGDGVVLRRLRLLDRGVSENRTAQQT